MDNKKATLELGTKPVGRLLWQFALPAIIAMTASSLYNIADRVFLGQVVGPLAISGLAITLPFMNLPPAAVLWQALMLLHPRMHRNRKKEHRCRTPDYTYVLLCQVAFRHRS